MNEIIERWSERLRFQRRVGMLRRDQQGQALIFVALAFFVLLAAVGLGIDLGLVYVERVKVAQAADAAALAAAPELPTKEAAHVRALIYLQGNGYDYEAADTQLAIDTYSKDGKYTGADPGGNTTIWIDTAYAQELGADDKTLLSGTANRIKVRVRRQVFMTFMQFVGFTYFPVEATAEAENINRVDTVIVYDRSGSMEYNTLCYGCWESEPGIQYPSGNIFPLQWSSTTTATADHCADACEETDYVSYKANYQVNDCNYYHEKDDEYYIVIEAEEYSDISVVYQSDYYELYKTYWVVQRNAENAAFKKYGKWEIKDVGAMGRDGRGAYLSHHPYRDVEDWTGGLGVSCALDALQKDEKCRYEWAGGRPDGTLVERPYPKPFDAPRADYEFYAPRSGDYYFWIRGQAGIQQTKWGRDRNNRIFWGINNEYADAGEKSGFPPDVGYDGAIKGSWDWRCLGTKNLPEGSATLNLWAGGAGFDVDRIVITTNNKANACAKDNGPPGKVEDFDPNNGRTNRACGPCDPRFAGRPGGQEDPYRPHCPRDTRFDDIYDDEQPIRDALEAAKYYAGMWDPLFDQVGYVSYSTKAVIECELQCLRDPSVVGACNSTVITNTVIAALDKTRAGGSTNIADGISQGIEVLGSSEDHYGRPGAAHIMVLLTDGQANLYPNDKCWGWSASSGATDEEKAAACVIYYAQQAANSDILIYTITLGWGADQELMKQVAEITKGKHFHAPSASALNGIFEELYKLVFVRLVQ